ncbi:MAG: hypothetical protein KYX68_10575 [Flavobacterium sp.]|nr:hypothetical protein [Flavobacterium sp.]
MRKLLLSAAIIFALVSCSNDENNDKNYVRLVTASNTSGMMSYQDLNDSNGIVYSFSLNGVDNDGIYLDKNSMDVIVASRSNNRLEYYKNLEDAISGEANDIMLSSFSSNTEFNNPREIAVYNDKIIVTQDQSAANNNTNKLFVYQKSLNGFSLLNEYTVDFKLWGIHLQGNDLYAIADLTSDLVYFENIFNNASGMITPTKRVTIEGLVRTHGITHSSSDNVMILTDVASAASDSDGGLVIIENFSSVFSSTANMGTIAMSNQKRIYGPNSTLGNPVDVAYDSNTNRIYVAERANGGGKVLTFSYPSMSGDVMPITSRLEPGVASIYLLK